MSPKKVWITPKEAARLMSELAGYIVTPDDIKQMKRRGKITKTKKLSERITLYHVDEIKDVKPPKKRNPQPIFHDFEKDAKIGSQTP